MYNIYITIDMILGLYLEYNHVVLMEEGTTSLNYKTVMCSFTDIYIYIHRMI